MSLIVQKKEGGSFHLAPDGTHQAVCFGAWDIGVQETEFKGKKVWAHKCVIGFELNETIESDDSFNGKRYTIFKRYTASLHEKANLRKDLVSWRGKDFTKEEEAGFDLEKLIAVNAMITVVHSEVGDRKYANINSIGKLMKNLMPIKPENGTEMPEWVEKLKNKAIVSVPDEPDHAVEQAAVDSEDLPF